MGKSKNRGIFASILNELLVELPKTAVNQVLGTKPAKKKANSGQNGCVKVEHHHHHHDHHHHTFQKLEVHTDYELKVVKKNK